jgi:hypothetical protein
LKRVLQKNEENESCRKTLDLQIRFCSFFVDDSSTEATELARKSPKFPCGPKVEAFTVRIFDSIPQPAIDCIGVYDDRFKREVSNLNLGH